MNFLWVTIASLLGAVFGGVLGLALSMLSGGLITPHEPGAYLGVVMAIVLVPVGALFGSALSGLAAARLLGARHLKPSEH